VFPSYQNRAVAFIEH